MRFDKLTTKFQQALGDSQSLALAGDNAYIEPQHLLLAMLDDPQLSDNVRWQSQLRAALLFNRSGKVQRAMDLLAQVQADERVIEVYLGR